MDNKVREIAYEYQLLQAQIEVLSRNLELLSLAKAEMELVKETLNNLEKDSKILIPIGAGSYLKGAVTESNKVIVGVGSGYLVEMTTSNAVEFIEKRIEEYNKLIEKTSSTLKLLENRLTQLAVKVEELQKASEETSES